MDLVTKDNLRMAKGTVKAVGRQTLQKEINTKEVIVII